MDVLNYSRLAFAIVCLLLPVTSFEAQTDKACGKRKIAFYDQMVLEGPTGVKRLSNAIDVAVNPGFVPGRTEQASKEGYEKRRRILVDPLLKEINESIERIANYNQIVLLETSGPDETSIVLALNPGFDITTRLIPILNKEAAEKTDISVEKSRVAFVDTRKFFDADQGLFGFRGNQIEHVCAVTKKCMEVGEKLKDYAIRNQISAIFDSSKELPKTVAPFLCNETTADFISYYNKASR